MKRIHIRTLFLALAVGALSLTGVLVWALGTPLPKSLYQPSLKRSLTQEQRWKLDFDIANEASMKEHNSRRFEAPGSFEKRARWFEETAVWYTIADLMQQMIDFRKSAMVNNEKAFNELVALGKQGDVGATCMAAFLYRSFKKEDTADWKYSLEQVVSEALKESNTSHPVCALQKATLFFTGELGHPKDRAMAKPYVIKEAVAGFYGSQMYLVGLHQPGELRFMPREFELSLCWRRVADAQASIVVDFRSACNDYKRGTALNEHHQSVPLPESLQQMAREWCEPSRIVTAQTCADLEQQYESK